MESLLQIIQANRRAVLITGVALLTIVVALGYRLVAVGYQAPPAVTVSSSPEPGALVTVDIEGAVAVPGVRKLTAGSLVDDAIAVAGGLTAAADLQYVAAKINRAAELKNHQQIYIPALGESAVGAGGQSAPESVTGKVNLNQATQAELEALPGIGEATADKIIEYRETHGGFSAIEDLQQIPGIGDKKFADLQELIEV